MVKVNRGCFYVYEDFKNESDIKVALKEGLDEDSIPENQKELYLNIEETLSIIRILIKTDENIKREYCSRLLSLAQVGLAMENPLTNLAQEALNTLKNDICLQEGGRIKNEYLQSLGLYALLLSTLIIAVRLVLNNMNIFFLDKYAYTFTGAMIGTWISFGARKINLTFKELSVIESDRLSAVLRLLFIGICSCIVLLFIDNNVIQFNIGSISNSEVTNSIEWQFIIGITVGLIEYRIGSNLHNKVNNLLN